MPRTDARPLTDRHIRSLKPDARTLSTHPDGTVDGLRLRIFPTGRKVWSFTYRVGRRNAQGDVVFYRHAPQRRVTLGPYPALSLAAARKQAQALLTRVKNGEDPAAAREAARTQDALTVDRLVTRYLASRRTGGSGVKQLKPRTLDEYARILTGRVLAAWQDRAVEAITRREIRELIATITAPVAANRTQAVISSLFRWAVQHDWIAVNPATALGKHDEHARKRVLTDDELRQLWTVLETQRTPTTGRAQGKFTKKPAGAVLDPVVALGLQVLLLTAQRPGEVFSMERAELDDVGGWWTIPEEKTKNGQLHRVPLTPRVLTLLDEVGRFVPDRTSPFVFGGQRGASVATRAKKAMRDLRRAHPIAGDVWRHDLRRTASTHMGAAGITRADIAHVLNHAQRDAPDVTQIYDRYTYDREKRIALEVWGRRLDQIVTGTADAATVVPFTRP